MKSKLLNLGLIVTSLLGYLEWGKDMTMFLFQGEAEIVVKLFKDPISVIHPFTVLPMTGQIILLITLFQKQPGRKLSLVGMGCIAILFLLIFVIGIMTLKLRIFLSTIPFLTLGVLRILRRE